MKLDISNKPSEAAKRKEEPCGACSGSGYYDDWNRKKNRPYDCSSCNGTGFAHPELHKPGENYRNL